MEKLNEYLQTLLSTCSYELHLEPNKAPFMLHATGTTEVANSPPLGTQISTIVFPLIPPAEKQQLPNQSEVEFVHSNNLGNFSFLVKKSPAGFNVTIRPLFSEDGSPSPAAEQNEPEPLLQSRNPNPIPFDLSKLDKPPVAPETPAQIDTADSPDEIEIIEPIETASVYDPEFTTQFSDSATFNSPFRPHQYSEPSEVQESEVDDYVIPSGDYLHAKTLIDDYTPAFETGKADFSVADGFGSQMRLRMNALFQRMAEVGASDLHMSVSVSPMVRKDGKMMRLECAEGEMSPSLIKELLYSIMPEKNREEFEQSNDTDFAYEIEGLARFRANIFADRKGMGGVFRIIPAEILTAKQLGLSKSIMDLCDLSKGLVVVTGPTGSGKSTTLCAMIDSINKSREDHIITIEDPIEFTHENQKCLVNQREVYNHTDSFKDALRAALREDPDILLVGEMRDLETISIAIETAETGHLVFGTLHTTTAASTVDRIIDQFPSDRQQQVRVMLSESLRGVIAQTLLPKKGGGRIAALEVLIVTPAISNLIREGKTFQIPSSMQTGKAHGMVMLNDALMELVKKDLVEPRDAYIKAVDKAGFESLLKREGIKI